MMRTDEENERDAYAAGQYRLSDAFSRIIDLENQACEYRALVREAVDFIPSAAHSDHIIRELHRIDKDTNG